MSWWSPTSSRRMCPRARPSWTVAPGTIIACGTTLVQPSGTRRISSPRFAAYDLEESEQQLQKDEVIELVPMPLDEALDLVWSGRLSDAKSALALIYAARKEGLLSQIPRG